jgi:hypothetical protein
MFFAVLAILERVRVWKTKPDVHSKTVSETLADAVRSGAAPLPQDVSTALSWAFP